MFVAVLQPGDVLHHCQPGGGGFGEAYKRDPAAVARDVRDEKVSVTAARELYRVACDSDGVVDLEETSSLRRRAGGS